MNYVEKNEKVLEKWRKHIERIEPDPNFADDGILFRGKIGESERYPDEKKENELWSNAPIRYLFLTKDQNAGEEEQAWDVRSEIGRDYKSSTSIRYRFYRNLMYILYGLIHNRDEVCGYEDFTNENAIQTYDETPLARINVKKQAGSKSIDNGTLQDYIERDKKFLQEQISVLEADVIICCGYSDSINETGNLILNFLNKYIYNFEEIDDWIYFDKENKKVAINAWHLSYSGISQKAFYEGIVSSYHKFIKEYSKDYPELLKHR